MTVFPLSAARVMRLLEQLPFPQSASHTRVPPCCVAGVVNVVNGTGEAATAPALVLGRVPAARCHLRGFFLQGEKKNETS